MTLNERIALIIGQQVISLQQAAMANEQMAKELEALKAAKDAEAE